MEKANNNADINKVSSGVKTNKKLNQFVLSVSSFEITIHLSNCSVEITETILIILINTPKIPYASSPYIFATKIAPIIAIT